MNIFDIVAQREKQMEILYRDLANSTKNVGLKKIFNMLADEESTHTKIVDIVKNKIPETKRGELIADAKVILSSIKKQKDFSNLEDNQIEIYKKARESEKESELLYRTEAEKAQDPALKEALLHFAKEEERHFHLMDEIVQFVERPEFWIESAEFSSLDRY